MASLFFNQLQKEQESKMIGWVLAESSNDGPLGPVNIVDKNGRRVIGEGRLQRANRKNRNGRFYDDKELFPAVVAPRIKELLSTGFGSENGHPMDKDLVRQQTIDPNNVVAYFLKIWTDGDYIMGNFRGSNLPIGEAFDMDLREGFLPAWSLRALGGIENTSRGAEVRGIKIITWDRVYYPSHPEAYTLKVLGESGDYTRTESGIYIPKTPNPEYNEKICEEGLVAPITNKDVLDYIKEQSLNYKQICNEFEVMYDDIKLIDEGTKVQLSNSKTGNIFIVRLENYIQNEIAEYCDSNYHY